MWETIIYIYKYIITKTQYKNKVSNETTIKGYK